MGFEAQVRKHGACDNQNDKDHHATTGTSPAAAFAGRFVSGKIVTHKEAIWAPLTGSKEESASEMHNSKMTKG